MSDQDDIQAAHLRGEHYGDPDPDCWICWEDGEPEAPRGP